MRSIISLLLLSFSFAVLAQRVTFEDPDLTFSFKKPKSWEVFDDGYVVKITPSPVDSSDTYITITYFESPKPIGDVPLDLLLKPEPAPDPDGEIKIARKIAKFTEAITNGYIIRSYTFTKFDQRFEIITKYSQSPGIKRQFKTIIRSIKVTR